MRALILRFAPSSAASRLPPSTGLRGRACAAVAAVVVPLAGAAHERPEARTEGELPGLPSVPSAPPAAAAASVAPAVPAVPAVRACADAAERALRQQYPLLAAIEPGAARVSPVSPHLRGVEGEGRWRGHEDGWRDYRYRCLYNARDDSTSNLQFGSGARRPPLTGAALPAPAIDPSTPREVVLRLEAGAPALAVKGSIRGYDRIDYRLQAGAGQVLKLALRASNTGTCFDLLEPDGGQVLFTGERDGAQFNGALRAGGAYTIRVYQVRSFARRGSARFTLSVALS